MTSPRSRRQRDGQPAAQVLHHHHRMHVRLPTYSRGVAELGCDQPDRGDDIFLPLILALSLPQVSEHCRGTQRSAPGPEILGRVREVRDALDVVVDIMRIDILPLPVFEIPEQPGTRRREELGNESHQVLTIHDVPLRDRSLADVLELNGVVIEDEDVGLAHRSDAESVVLLLVLLAVDAKEYLRDQPDDSRAYLVFHQPFAMEIALDLDAQRREI